MQRELFDPSDFDKDIVLEKKAQMRKQDSQSKTGVLEEMQVLLDKKARIREERKHDKVFQRNKKLRREMMLDE